MANKKVNREMRKTMRKFKRGELHSGSKKGPIVTKVSQAKAIGLSKVKKNKSKKRGENV